jgi:hypothetical protein
VGAPTVPAIVPHHAETAGEKTAEQQVINSYYDSDMTVREAGGMLGLCTTSESSW